MLDIKQLTARRGTIRSKLTRFVKYVDACKNDTDFNLDELQERLDEIKTDYKAFYAVQETLELVDDENLQDHNLVSEDFEKKYFTSVGEAKSLLKAPLQVSGFTNQEPNFSSNTKLPEIKLPEFSGSYDAWRQFHDNFDALINRNSSLNKIQKYYYLTGCLKNEAAQLVSSLTVSEENYDTAWQLLKDRYENKRAIITSHIKGIVELPTVQRESHSSLRTYLDTFLKHYRSLKTLDETVEYWDTLLFYLLCSKLDISTRKEWEGLIKGNRSPNIKEFIQFLTDRCNFLESFESKPKDNKDNKRPVQQINSRPKYHSYLSTNTTVSCAICKSNHSTSTCKQLLDLPVDQRIIKIKSLSLCTNCFRTGHTNFFCKASKCRICHKKHNTCLHMNAISTATPSNAPIALNNNAVAPEINDFRTENSNMHVPSTSTSNLSVKQHCAYSQDNTFTFLSTAIVYLSDSENHLIKCRCILDSGSQSNIITRRFVEGLGLHTAKINCPISGINQSLTNISSQCTVNLFSFNGQFQAQLNCLVIEEIAGLMPQQRIDVSHLEIPKGLQLADDTFYEPSPIDLLLGAGIFYDLLCSGMFKLGPGLPVLKETQLGWIVAGPLFVPNAKYPNNNTSLFVKNADLQSQLERFWLVEENYTHKGLSREQQECETEFSNNFTRDSTGRFEVTLPLRENYAKLGNSLTNATNRFYSLEKKFSKNETFKKNYVSFIDEYISLGHMTVLKPEEIDSTNMVYYLPHHGVEKTDSLTTKLRVVFDASAKTSSGLSLNDVLKVGPTIQSDLFSILLRFRQHTFVLTGDIAKMYRQVKVVPEQRDLQRIVWRENPHSELKHYRLNTLTYGTAPASFLATRCLKQLATENANIHPQESAIISNDFYVDDLITGCSDLNSLITLRKNITQILSDGGFDLRKFCSNDNRVLQDLREHENMTNYVITDSDSQKTLGVSWNPKKDYFQYSTAFKSKMIMSKRNILSYVSQIFDPLTLLGPVTVQAKLLIQKLWQLRVGWDDPIPQSLSILWSNFLDDINYISHIKIPRHALLDCSDEIQLHGFCDASERAYGAAIYIRSRSAAGIKTILLCAKSRVAPIKSLTLPRLELSGALLLTKLMQRVKHILTVNINKCFYWTDSTIVLSWLAAEPQTWQTFVSNRVSEIQQNSEINNWHHVRSAENPADIISRGTSAKDLSSSSLWWHGPTFLKLHTSDWPQNSNISRFAKGASVAPEIRRKNTVLNCILGADIFEKFSSFSKLQRIIALCLRFIRNTRLSQGSRSYGFISTEEIMNATTLIIKTTQMQVFQEEISCLQQVKQIKPSSRLSSLAPFLDSEGILRVGGRLSNASLKYSAKHQIILPANHYITKLIIQYEHVRNLHPGPQSTLYIIRQAYWPLNGLRTVKGVLKGCVTCFKARPTSISQQMANLPESRVVPSKPFLNCGVDYAGPFKIKDGKTRNRKIVKGYVCIFVCLATKAVHLELAHELTTDSFLNALKRFVSRRGLCSKLFSDNATNFRGANNDLKSILNLIKNDKFQNYVLENSIHWNFIPARSPHMGGIWEAGVKAVKYHLLRVATNFNFTFEEFYTLLTQVEAVLNSRPLTPLSNSPNDLEPLTPGHFLIGQPMVAVPQAKVDNLASNRLSRYQHLCKMLQDIWSRWSKEYLHHLQQRTKWRFRKDLSSIVGALVLLKEDGSPPQHWPMGRITAVYPGTDGAVRVVGVKTKGGETKRAVTRICLLPITD